MSMLATRRRPTKGYTLLELIVGITIGAIVMAMAITAVTLSLTTYNQELTHGQAAQSLQLALGQVDQMVMSTTTPTNAWSGAGSTAPSTGHPYCWGNSQPGSQALASPQTTAIIAAHDYDIKFCGYLANQPSATPHVYRIWVDTTACDGTSLGRCTLKITDYGPSGDYGTTPSGCSPTTTPCPPAPVDLYTLNNVWCDSYCQGPAGVACADLSPAPTGGCAAATPPLFAYYDNQGTLGTQYNQPTTPLLDVNSAGAPTDDLTAVHSVTVSLSILPASGTITPTAGGPGITATSQLLLRGT